MKNVVRIAVSLFFALATQSLAHEFWLEPKIFQGDREAEVGIELRNGQDFKGLELSWFAPRIASAKVIQGEDVEDYQGQPGDLPAMTVDLNGGLTTVAYASIMSRLTYDSWEKVISFVTHKDIPWFEARHAERGLPETGVTEGYWRFSKTLVAGPDGTGADVDTGMETEFVALTNPFTDEGPMRVRLLYQGSPRADAQVEMWEKTGKVVEKTLHRTDEQGIVTLPVRPGYSYQIDSVVLREPESEEAIEDDVMWESLWANMTFAVPE